MTLTVLSSAVQNEEDFPSDPELLELLWQTEDHHFWIAARNDWIAQALSAHGVRPGARILEVGCGSGAVARHLHQLGYQVTGVDTSLDYTRKAEQRCPQARFIAGDVREVPTEMLGRFDAVGVFDVLEHLDDPESFLRDSLRFARDGAVVAATVPGLRALYSVIDELSGHKMRYEPGELAALLARCGLTQVAEFGIFRLASPLLRISRRRQRADRLSEAERRKMLRASFGMPPAPLNLTMRLMFDLERRLGFRFAQNRPGASLLAVGRVG